MESNWCNFEGALIHVVLNCWNKDVQRTVLKKKLCDVMLCYVQVNVNLFNFLESMAGILERLLT